MRESLNKPKIPAELSENVDIMPGVLDKDQFSFSPKQDDKFR